MSAYEDFKGRTWITAVNQYLGVAGVNKLIDHRVPIWEELQASPINFGFRSPVGMIPRLDGGYFLVIPINWGEPNYNPDVEIRVANFDLSACSTATNCGHDDEREELHCSCDDDDFEDGGCDYCDWESPDPNCAYCRVGDGGCATHLAFHRLTIPNRPTPLTYSF